MEGSIRFAFVVHCHQPPDNLPWANEEVYERAYLPLLETMRRQGSLRFCLHISGALLEWLAEAHPEFIESVRGLVDSGRLELLGGAAYEPILGLISGRDALAQIEHLNRLLLQMFSYQPRGMWLPERVWEPHLPALLAEAGMAYTLVDGENVAEAGLGEEECLGSVVTEHQGERVVLFPIDSTLRHCVPFQPPQVAIDYLRSKASADGRRLAVWADDGEKLGAWPGTHKLLYEDGWLDAFFSALASALPTIRTTTLRQYLVEEHPLRRVYLPPCSYSEMMEWSGGNFRNFLVRYQESNLMHKRMMRVSRKVAEYGERARRVGELRSGRVSWEELERAQRLLWKAQTNCPYWHGVFGGIYLPHLRQAVYRRLVEAEAIVDRGLYERGDVWRVEVTDLDCDGGEEVLLEGPRFNFYVNPDQGGAVFELDSRNPPLNLVAALRGRREAYHGDSGDLFGRGIPTEGRYPRLCFVDHFLHPEVGLPGFADCVYGEQWDFVDQPYSFDLQQLLGGREVQVRLWREGHVWIGGEFVPISVEKTLRADARGGPLEAFYLIQNRSAAERGLWFAVEWNFLLTGHYLPERRLIVDDGETHEVSLEERVEAKAVRKARVQDDWVGLGVGLEFSPVMDFWHFPLSAACRTEEGPAVLYEGSSLVAHKRLVLAPGERWGCKVGMTIGE